MSSLLRTARQTPRVLAHIQRAGFVSSTRVLSGKEDYLHTETEAGKQQVEKTKQETKGKEWDSDLASNSESIVKAERDETKSTEEYLEKLKKETEGWAKGQQQK